MAMYNFIYSTCDNADNEQPVPYKDQGTASSVYQRYKKQMKAVNDDRNIQADLGEHFVKVAVTDTQGKIMESYRHNCYHLSL